MRALPTIINDVVFLWWFYGEYSSHSFACELSLKATYFQRVIETDGVREEEVVVGRATQIRMGLPLEILEGWGCGRVRWKKQVEKDQ